MISVVVPALNEEDGVRELAAADHRFKINSLTRNFGHQPAPLE